MLFGYQDSLTKVIDSLTTGSFNNLFRKYVKETYHLCYTFTELYNIKVDPILIKYLKRNNLNLLNYSYILLFKNSNKSSICLSKSLTLSLKIT
jgi:hypothetical protein